jgi:hypothetical protein
LLVRYAQSHAAYQQRRKASIIVEGFNYLRRVPAALHRCRKRRHGENRKTPYAKKMKKRRQATVEPVLGTLINFMGLRRIWTRGLQSANKFMLGAAIAYNLKKWLNYHEQKRKTAVVAIKKTKEGLCSLFLMLWHSIAVCHAKTKISNHQ